jgi:beta-mannosidase
VLDRQQRRVGFKDVAWEPCAGAPADAMPWICVVNGRKIFLQGANWVPLAQTWADVTAAQYQSNIAVYQQMGCTVLRVWGGAVLASTHLYDACDVAGILVWQEFPLSSSGPDNGPPSTSTAIGELTQIASSYIERRQHHASLLLWCGGNELQSANNDQRTPGIGRPWGNEHPTLAALGRVVATLDPGRRFLPSSSSGPRFCADAADFGKGLHHDVHGPWDSTGTDDAWADYWQRDDALLRSETGVPGAGPLHLITRSAGSQQSPLSAYGRVVVAGR